MLLGAASCSSVQGWGQQGQHLHGQCGEYVDEAVHVKQQSHSSVCGQQACMHQSRECCCHLQVLSLVCVKCCELFTSATVGCSGYALAAAVAIDGLDKQHAMAIWHHCQLSAAAITVEHAHLLLKLPSAALAP